MDKEKEGNQKTRFYQTIVGYLIVIGTIVLITCAIVFFQSLDGGKYAGDIKEGVLYKVISVLDGDTLIVNISGKEVTLRLIGIDTPEVVDPRKPVQCYGYEASGRAKELLLGKEVYIEKEKSKGNYDMYGRVLAYVIFVDGGIYNQQMIEEGFAREYTFNKEKYKYQKEFKEAQKIAKTGKYGLWGKCPN